MTRVQRVHLYTVCWDEADMLGFFFRHYDGWIDRYVVYDDGSTDGSLDILRAHPKVEVRTFERSIEGSFCLSHKAMQDEAWKESRGKADWVVVTAIDEHLHVRGCPMAEYLDAQARSGVTLVPALGFDMNHPTMPDDRGCLVDTIVHGRPRSAFNKLSIFDPDAIRETGFAVGRHAAEPIGDLRLPATDDLMLWHYKHLGFERNALRESRQAQRLGSVDLAGGLGQHYLWSKDRLRKFWDQMESEASDLSRPGFIADQACVRPLWWDDRSEIARLEKERARTEPVPPRVSVLMKAYNHAPFIGQAIQSLLDQDFTDFEIVVTDDGSIDGTADIVRTFDDPRIRLVALRENTGISAAMNATIARARGRYLAILNSDDVALPKRLARQVAFLDSNPAIAAVFGMPKAIDEAGEATMAFFDFSAALSLPDHSRQSWLRFLFLHGNCLCAPTAMIRSEVFEKIGGYDLRLHNLHDYDFWVRMQIENLPISVLKDELIAFRVRRNDSNASAPRIDNAIRSNFERLQVLNKFRRLDEEMIRAVFGDADSAFGWQDLGRMAARSDDPGLSLFGMQLLYDEAKTPVASAEVGRLAKFIDVFNLSSVEALRSVEASLASIIDRQAATASRFKTMLSAAFLPAQDFDEARYLRENPDVGTAVFAGAFASGYEHWIKHGATEGRPAFPRTPDPLLVLSG